MAIKAKIAIDNSEIKQGLKDVEQQAKKTGAAVGRDLNNKNGIEALDKLGDNADKAVQAIDGIAGAAGAASTGIGGLAGDIVSLVKNPMAALIAACGALVAIGTNMWDKLTLSAEEYRKKLDFINQRNQKALTDQVKNEVDSADIFERLRSLNSKDNGLEIIFLIDKLQKKYGDLGITIDATTNKVLGLDAAQQKIIKLEGQRTLAAASRAAKDWERTANADLAEALEALDKNFNRVRAINPKGKSKRDLVKEQRLKH
jgi:hypothetical protein